MTKTTRDDNHVVIDRNGIIENRHQLHAVVVDSTGRVLLAVGDPDRVTLVRSAAKPAQAVAIVETGALECYSLDDADLALMCASHSSEERHVDRARRILAAAGNAEADLRCGGHPAILADRNAAWLRAGFDPTPVWSNCSGKHAGMLAAARAIGAGPSDYHLLSHPLQQRVRRVTEEIAGLPAPEQQIRWAVDGCNMPAPAYPLVRLATTYAAFADAADGDDEAPPARRRSMARVFRAMAAHPDMVAGEGRFCTELMRAFGGRVVGKVGADACYGVGVRAGEDTRRLGAVGAVGIAAKVEDGNMDILYGAVAEILGRLEIGDAETRAALDGFHGVVVKNTVGVVTGRVSYPFKLQAVQVSC
ncbi:L-asparaginase II [Cordyceps fumosorosea ARSEF 2679]|uniref:L-asparaginase II n=1 Tax=Cordyceps fumosorosea (strain ARSEF 2679) TaxID=1081104 RepID=A0A167SBJ1_CORFA|nr:L-asparaginase II [Cordyceps fumosorosea ARSEF 2679]OAA59455.1 L-asparaginase II [Cordyceps fumosorosea ARSEF 2679]